MAAPRKREVLRTKNNRFAISDIVILITVIGVGVTIYSAIARHREFQFQKGTSQLSLALQMNEASLKKLAFSLDEFKTQLCLVNFQMDLFQKRLSYQKEAEAFLPEYLKLLEQFVRNPRGDGNKERYASAARALFICVYQCNVAEHALASLQCRPVAPYIPEIPDIRHQVIVNGRCYYQTNTDPVVETILETKDMR